MRPAALLVLLLAAGISLLGVGSMSLQGSAEDPVPSEIARVSSPTPTEAAVVVPTERQAATSQPQPTVTQPSPPTSTPVPSPTTEVATERPIPPPTGVDEASYILQRGESGRKEVAFTFDAGEGAGHTAEILDILDRYGIKGSFGITGQWAEQNPDLLKRIVDEGHMLINHTYDHRSWTGVSKGEPPLTDDERMQEIKKTEQIIFSITGYETQPYFRFPYGDYDQASLVTLKQAGYDYTLWWTCDTQAWNGNTGPVIAGLCGPDAESGGPGAVILMHVVQDGDLAALPSLIDAYQAEGYSIVTMEQMVQP